MMMMGGMGGSGGSMNNMGMDMDMMGSMSQGQMPMDQMAMGPMPMAQMPMGPMPMDQMATGQMPMGHMPVYGQFNISGSVGHMPYDPSVMTGMANHMQTNASGFGLQNGDFTGLLTGIFNFAIYLFAILLIVGLVVGLVVFLKKYLTEGDNKSVFFKNNQARAYCVKCGKGLNADWQHCPTCGTTVNRVQTVNEAPNTSNAEPQTV